MSIKEILAVTDDRDLILRAVSTMAQRDLQDPNLSETYKEATIEVVEQVLASLPKKVDSTVCHKDRIKLDKLRVSLKNAFRKDKFRQEI